MAVAVMYRVRLPVVQPGDRFSFFPARFPHSCVRVVTTRCVGRVLLQLQKVVTPARIVSGTIRTMEAHSDAINVTKEGAVILSTLARSDTYRRSVVRAAVCPCLRCAVSLTTMTCSGSLNAM